MSYRRFGAADEEIAKAWSAKPEAIDAWSLGIPIGKGEAGSFHATSDKAGRGACKPAFHGNGASRGAHERIASDLAFALKLPVPAVCLWTDPITGALYSISAWAFPQALTWAEAATRLSAVFMQNAAPTFSAARVFHSWIGDTDHNGNGGNVVVDVSSSDERPGIAFIDHAFSMSYTPQFATQDLAPLPLCYVPDGLVNMEATQSMVAEINGLEQKFIENTVRRIPAAFLPPDRGEAIIEGLVRRPGELERAFGIVVA
jgi:hypothetical protein